MRMVFVNLIRNACQAIRDDGKIAIKVRFQNKIVITLEDNGCGIPHGNLDRVFEPFFTTKPHGLGLGLMNARNIVEEHNGTIQVNSEMGSGTTFVIELPIGET
jgi:two-component system, sporulation sensor kinase E